VDWNLEPHRCDDAQHSNLKSSTERDSEGERRKEESKDRPTLCLHMNTSVPRLVLKGETTKPECPRHSPQVELELAGRQPSIDSHGMRFRWEGGRGISTVSHISLVLGLLCIALCYATYYFASFSACLLARLKRSLVLFLHIC